MPNGFYFCWALGGRHKICLIVGGAIRFCCFRILGWSKQNSDTPATHLYASDVHKEKRATRRWPAPIRVQKLGSFSRMFSSSLRVVWIEGRCRGSAVLCPLPRGLYIFFLYKRYNSILFFPAKSLILNNSILSILLLAVLEKHCFFSNHGLTRGQMDIF